jgi:hypothetical protein
VSVGMSEKTQVAGAGEARQLTPHVLSTRIGSIKPPALRTRITRYMSWAKTCSAILVLTLSSVFIWKCVAPIHDLECRMLDGLVTSNPVVGARARCISPPVANSITIGSCRPLALTVGSRSSECFGRINMRSFLSSPLVVVGKGIKLIRNRSVGHGLGSTEQSLCCF